MKCSFCGSSLPKGRGKMLVKKSGQILYFCGSKCDRNYSMGREGKSVRWTETHRKLKGKEARPLPDQPALLVGGEAKSPKKSV